MSLKNYLLFIKLWIFTIICNAQIRSSIFSPYDFGAKGDSKTIDTKAIQAAIDSCHNSGGGKVYLHSGTFISGTLYLKSNVTLYIEAGTTLKGSDNLEHFPSIPSNHSAYQKSLETNKMLIYAEDVKNISILGRGTIDGNGNHWVEGPYGFPSFSKRPRIIHFRGCENVTIRDITLYNSASWVQSYQSCRNMVIDGITVDSRENKDIEKKRFTDAPGRNTDGLDLIDCQQVRISNCYINSGDDGICLKSLSPDEGCRNITITNCVVSTNASGIKIGTETAGKIEDITINNCVVYDTRIDALSIMTVDGTQMERINFSNITCRNIKGSAIFVRLGNRNRTYREGAKINTQHLKDIIFENIQGTRISEKYGNIIAGLKDIPIENIILRNINLEFEGGKNANQADLKIPENEQKYPNGHIFGELPSYGFYVRHAKNVTLDNVQLRFINDDERPALFCDDVEYLSVKGFKAQSTLNSPELIKLINARNATISESRSMNKVHVFLSIQGKTSSNIIIVNNYMNNVVTTVDLGEGISRNILTEVSIE